MNIVMLNLLISILSNTFEQVMSIQRSDDLRKVCNILIENCQLFKKLNDGIRSTTTNKNNDKTSPGQYLHMLTEISHMPDVAQDEDEEWRGRVKYLLSQIDRVENNVKKQLSLEVKRLGRRQDTSIKHIQTNIHNLQTETNTLTARHD